MQRASGPLALAEGQRFLLGSSLNEPRDRALEARRSAAPGLGDGWKEYPFRGRSRQRNVTRLRWTDDTSRARGRADRRQRSGEFIMPSKPTVKAYRGDVKTLLAFNLLKSGTKNLAGFTVHVEPKGQPTSGISLYAPGKKTGVLVTGKPLKTKLPPPFDQVRSIGAGHQIHHKRLQR